MTLLRRTLFPITLIILGLLAFAAPALADVVEGDVGDAASLNILITVAGASVVTLGLLELAKRALWPQASDPLSPDAANQDRWAPALAILIGIAVVELAGFGLGLLTRQDIVQGVYTGIFAGLSAVGLFTTLKRVSGN